MGRRNPTKHAACSEPESPPFCPHCGGRSVRPHGDYKGRGRFMCRACGRTSYGETTAPAPKPIRHPCPHCGGRCHKGGPDYRGRPRYHCTVCGRWNTRLYPQDPRPPGGPFPHKFSICLNVTARDNIVRYCNATGLKLAQAVRAIFTEAGQKPLACIASARRVYDAFGQVDDIVVTRRSVQGEPINPATPLPSVQWEAASKFSRQTGAEWHAPTVVVAYRYTIRLNDAAKVGLLQTMRARRMNQQEAARCLPTEARAGQ